MDWKEALLAQSRAMGIEPTEDTTPQATETKEDTSYLKDKLNIVMERKGRAGKTATIIEGFTCSEERLKAIAARLKQRLGTGGSARGGEILIQGDRRRDVSEALRALGFTNVKP